MAKAKPARLLYLGPVTSFSVVTPGEDGESQRSDDRPLITGVTYGDLPGDHPVIQNMVAAKLLIPAPEETPEASPGQTMTDSTTTKRGADRSTSRAAEEGNAK